MQNLGRQINPLMWDPDFSRIRQDMQTMIYDVLVLRVPPKDDIASKKLQDLSRRWEEGLFKSAPTKEEYLNMDTFQSRFQASFWPTLQGHAYQTSQYTPAPTPTGGTKITMIPTPGMQQPQNANSNVMVSSAVDPYNMITTSASDVLPSSIQGTGSLMPNFNGSFSDIRDSSFHGFYATSNGFQQPTSHFSINSSNNMMAGQRVMSQMIPTTGFSTDNGSLSDIPTSNGFQQPTSHFSINASNNMMAGQRVMSQMIPTTGFSTDNGSFSDIRATLSNGFQQPTSHFSINASNNLMAGQRLTSQMIPNTGFSTDNNSQSSTDVESSDSSEVSSSVDSSGVESSDSGEASSSVDYSCVTQKSP